MTALQILSQGAEATIYKSSFGGRQCVIKERLVKSYRLPILDRKLTHRRLIQEVRCIMKCRKAGVRTPSIYLIDERKSQLFLEYIDGESAKAYFARTFAKHGCYDSSATQLAYSIGIAVASMHDADVVHGDLTTSNMLVTFQDEADVTLIDFGLASSQPLHEDKAVDLYVLERALQSTHPNCDTLIDEILRAYKAHSRRADTVFQKLSQVRSRGRKRTMVG